MNASDSGPGSVRVAATRLLAFCAGGLAMVLLILHLGYFAGSLGIPAERWTYDFLKLQDRRMQDTAGENRIVTVAGSNSLFGFDGRLIESMSPYRFVNFGTHGGFTVGYLARRLEGKLHVGDIVVVPLEFNNYKGRSRHKEFQHQQNIAWLQRHFNQFPLFTALENWYAPLELIAGGFARAFASSSPPFDFALVDEKADARCGSFENGRRSNTYDTRFANEYCNITMKLPFGEEVAKFVREGDRYGVPSAGETRSLNPDLHRLIDTVAAQGARIVFTWPAMTETRMPEARKARIRARILAFQKETAALGIRIHCNPDEARVRHNFFLDTPYHLNAWGATLRSRRLLGCLRDELGLDVAAAPSGAGGAPSFLNLHAPLYESISDRRAVGHDPMPFERAILDFVAIAQALDRYRQAHGSYPASKEWDGLHSTPGNAGRDWVRGLAPQYISALPVDARGSSDPSKQYRYKSDGKDFKLISHGVQDCGTVAGVAPEIVDPRRRRKGGCYAYGLWSSERAANW